MRHPMENTGDVLLQHGESKTDRQNLFIRNQIGWMTVIVILFCFWLFGIDSTYGFSIFPDEFAYWSYAAQAAGYDWSDIMSLSSYFSYGYGYVLFPVFVLCKDAVTAYRVAVGLNFVFLFIGYLALTGTVKRMLTDRNIPVALFCALAVIAPWNLFYTQMTMTEVFLASLYMVTGRILLCYLENNRLSALVLCVFTLMFLYIVHMRAIGIVLSGLIVLSVHISLRRKEKWHLLVAASLVVLLFVIAGFAKEQAFLGVYGGRNREFLTGSDYGGQIEKIQYIFTKDGFYDLLVSILGKILYLGLATYGLFYWGSFALGKQSVKLYRRIRNRVEATMPVDERTRQPFGILHGGATLALAETVAGLGSMILAKPDEIVVGMQVSGSHMSSAHEGDTVRAVGTIIHKGRSSHVWNVDVFTSTDKLVSSIRVVNSILKKK